MLLEPATGRVLAMAEHSRAQPGATGLALKAMAPAASIFKLVTAAALLEQGVSPGEQVCFHGGRHRLDPRLLTDDPRRDHRCTTLESAFGRSTNVVFAKLAGRGLDAPELRDAASRFLFNTPIPFPLALEPSTARIDDDTFQLANTAAGFGPVRLTPMHAALLAAIVANGGVFVPPVLVDEVEGAPAPRGRRTLARGGREGGLRPDRDDADHRHRRDGPQGLPPRHLRAARGVGGGQDRDALRPRSRTATTPGSWASRPPTTRRWRWRP